MSSAGIQKLFCGIYSAFKCSFDEFVGEKVFSPSYSSAILDPPPTKEIIIKVKRQPSEWEKIIANEATDKKLISKMYKQLL